MASNPVAAFGSNGLIESGKDTYADRTLCVQEIVDGKFIYNNFELSIGNSVIFC